MAIDRTFRCYELMITKTIELYSWRNVIPPHLGVADLYMQWQNTLIHGTFVYRRPNIVPVKLYILQNNRLHFFCHLSWYKFRDQFSVSQFIVDAFTSFVLYVKHVYHWLKYNYILSDLNTVLNDLWIRIQSIEGQFCV